MTTDAASAFGHLRRESPAATTVRRFDRNLSGVAFHQNRLNSLSFSDNLNDITDHSVENFFTRQRKGSGNVSLSKNIFFWKPSSKTVRGNSYLNSRPQSKYSRVTAKQRQKESIKVHVSRQANRVEDFKNPQILTIKPRPQSSNNHFANR